VPGKMPLSGAFIEQASNALVACFNVPMDGMHLVTEQAHTGVP
jgi:hypothetical protein